MPSLSDGNFYTANPKHPWASAVAIRGDRILYVGDEAGVAEFVGSAAAQYRLGGKLAIPGLIDGYTRNAAFRFGRADLVVLDRNLFEVDRYEIHEARPVAVVMDGQFVHGALQKNPE
jgi:predicted amidohydrolase YtcJ